MKRIKRFLAYLFEGDNNSLADLLKRTWKATIETVKTLGELLGDLTSALQNNNDDEGEGD